MKRTHCSSCGYDDLEVFLDLGLTPVADAYTRLAADTSPTYPLQLAVCTGCWLVQLLEVLPSEVLFESGYSFYTSASQPLSYYHELYARDVLATHRDVARQGVLEIGCNDGDFLRHFAQAGHPTLGIDPAEGPASAAETRGLLVERRPFSAKAADEILNQRGAPGLVVANHVLAHVEDVADVLEGIKIVLAPGGSAFLEVQYLPDLLLNNSFDLVYHEHRNFFSLTSLRSAVERWGLHVVAAELTDRQGGSLRVQVEREPRELSPTRDRLLASESVWLGRVETYAGFQGRAERIRDKLRDLVHVAGGSGAVIGYGAPAKATTLLNFCHLTSYDLECVYDTTPAKQNRYIPGTGIPIVEPQVLRSDSTYLLLAWNYARHVMRRHRRFNGDWIVPFPAPVVY